MIPAYPPNPTERAQRNGDLVLFMDIRAFALGTPATARPPARESARDGAGGGGVPSFHPPFPSPSRRRRAERSDAAVLLPVWQDDAAELRAQVAPLRQSAEGC